MYVYGVLREADRPRLPEAGIEGRPVGRVCHDGLAALVSDAPDGPVRPSRRNVMAHSQVLQDVVAGGAEVLPVRFGVVLPDAGAVRDELLVAHGATLHAELKELTGCVELDVTVVCPQEALLRSVVEADPRLAEASLRLRAASAEATYYERIALGETIAREVEAARGRLAAHVVQTLGPLAVDLVESEPRHEEMLVNVALLVERSRLAGFDAATEALGAELAAEMRVRCLGPLPPYHFVDLALEQEVGAWA